MPLVQLFPLDAEALELASEAPERYASVHSLEVGAVADLVREVARQTRSMVRGTGAVNPWGGFLAADGVARTIVGTCAYKGPPDDAGAVEIAYFTFPPYEGRGYGTAMAAALADRAAADPAITLVRAHTLPERNRSAGILEKLGFELCGEVVDPEDGPVWRWERPVRRSAATVRPATLADAGLLAELAARTFEDTFGAVNDPRDMALYLAESYSMARQWAELSDPAIAALLVEVDGQAAGYAMLRGGAPPPCVTDPRPLELWRFYVDRPWQGRGVAQTLMAAVGAEAARRGAGALWLGVWERNERAGAFYRKCGFTDVGSQPFVLGTDRQTDRIMSRRLTG